MSALCIVLIFGIYYIGFITLGIMIARIIDNRIVGQNRMILKKSILLAHLVRHGHDGKAWQKVEGGTSYLGKPATLCFREQKSKRGGIILQTLV